MLSVHRIALTICVILVGNTYELVSQERQLSADEKAKIRKKMKKEVKKKIGTIHVEGTVCDAKGDLLKNVEVKGTKSKLTGFWGESKDTDISKTVSGRFSLTFKDCSSVHLEFDKDGYRGFGEGFIAKEGKGNPPIRKVENLKVVLYKRWKIPHLKDYSGTLEYKAGGSDTIIVIAPEGPPLYDEPTKQVDNIHNPEALPKRSISMIPSTTEKGKIDTVRLGKLDEKTREGVYPKKLRVILKADKGGFIKYDPKEDVPLQVQMCEAPQKGYKKQIVLSAEKLDSMTRKLNRGQGGERPFFFRMNEYYGVGYFGRLSSRNRSEHFKLKVELYLQPNGTRRVSPYMNPDKTQK